MTLIDWIITILLSAFAGITNFILQDNHNVFELISSIIISCFAGVVAMFLCQEYISSQNLTAVIVSLSALGGRATIELFKNAAKEKIEKLLKND